MLRDLTGGSGRDIAARLSGQVEAAIEGARLARSAVRAELPSDRASELAIEVEHRGDEQRAELVALLATSLVTPIDREDLFRLSRSIDDVLDNLRDFVREYDLLHVDCSERFPEVLAAIEEGLDDLGDAIQQLEAAPGEAGPGALTAKKKCNRIRSLYQEAVAEVLDEPEVTPPMLKRRELLRRLDVVGLRLGEAADALADGAVKRSQ
jgi:uncharacterized protein